ncbi:FHA domain-containing protein [Calothrix sp. NIES-4071]|nr:FHA domain-containing protein [Calothrix sp. NIES-4071]BAZ64205.1 FHA domain-containing protein [Calothrix sp. NIES-4105]
MQSVSLELYHLQTNERLVLPANLSVILIGKPGDDGKQPDIDVSGFPDADIVSRVHAQIWVNGSEYQITDLGSSNGTYVNGVKLQPKVFQPIKFGDKISLGQGDKVSFIFRQQGGSAPTKIVTNEDEEDSDDTDFESEITIASKLLGLGLIIGGIIFLSTKIYVGIYLRSAPGTILCIVGVILLNYGGKDKRRLGWILIGLGIAIFIANGKIIGSVSLFSVLASFAAISFGFQLFSTGKVFDFNPLSLKFKQLFKKKKKQKK